MADINSGSAAGMAYRGGMLAAPGRPAASAGPGADADAGSRDDDAAEGCSPDDALIGMVELLFFAYRDFTSEADAILEQFDFGRAHHRVLHFVNRRPGLRVADLLDILRITKQSLARVLKQLVERDFIQQEAGANDRRERRLHLTAKGKALAVRLADLQTARIRSALAAAGPAGEDIARAFLQGMIGEGMIGPQPHDSSGGGTPIVEDQ